MAFEAFEIAASAFGLLAMTVAISVLTKPYSPGIFQCSDGVLAAFIYSAIFATISGCF